MHPSVTACVLHSRRAWVHKSYKLMHVCILHKTILWIIRTGKQMKILELPQLSLMLNNPLVLSCFLLNQPPLPLVLYFSVLPSTLSILHASFYLFIPFISNVWFVCVQCSPMCLRQCFKGGHCGLGNEVTTAHCPWGEIGPKDSRLFWHKTTLP